jgi:preprotein translocase subunit SecE
MTMATKTNPLQFVQQVRSEVSKVIWPTRREVVITSIMVFIMAMITALFFFFVDWMIRTGLQLLLGAVG